MDEYIRGALCISDAVFDVAISWESKLYGIKIKIQRPMLKG